MLKFSCPLPLTENEILNFSNVIVRETGYKDRRMKKGRQQRCPSLGWNIAGRLKFFVFCSQPASEQIKAKFLIRQIINNRNANKHRSGSSATQITPRE